MKKKTFFIQTMLLFCFCLWRTALQAQVPVYHGQSQFIDSRALITTRIDDHSDHTYVAQSSGVGTYATCQITRVFSGQIRSLTLQIHEGRFDDVGYVGSTRVTSYWGNTCHQGNGDFLGLQDVSNQVTINGNTATVKVNALETCCCYTGFGQDVPNANLPNVRFRWIVTLQQPCNSYLAFSTTNVSCKGGNDGKATAIVNNGFPPFTYQWSNGATTETATGLSAGTYSVLVRDDNGCATSGSVQVFEPSTALSASSQVTKSVSCTKNDGELTLSAAGGTSLYTFTLNGNTNTSGIFSNLVLYKG